MKLITRLIKLILLSIGILVLLIVVVFSYKDIPVNELKEKYAPPPSSFISIDGMDVHYRDEGNSLDSIPIVLIHGTGSSLHTFDEWTTLLKNEQRVIRMDLPAFGLTGPFPDRNYSIEKYVVFVEHFLSSLGVKSCVLAGNSLGGRIAWNFTVKNPKMVDKLVLIDASGYPSESKSVPIAFRIAGMPILKNLMTLITPRFMVKASVENVYADKTKVTESLVDRYFELTLRRGNRQGLVDRMNMDSDMSAHLNIKNIQQPTLVLWGDQDLLVPVKSAYQFHEDLPNDTLVIMKNVGHVPMEESPVESLEMLMAFLKSE
ncbi:MAG: alpha/beta hydrolase [Cyclobacteriaceae bacterium]|nr:alpha/beta hydrolase [Cyclobacteriaceae bacterium]